MHSSWDFPGSLMVKIYSSAWGASLICGGWGSGALDLCDQRRQHTAETILPTNSIKTLKNRKNSKPRKISATYSRIMASYSSG